MQVNELDNIMDQEYTFSLRLFFKKLSDAFSNRFKEWFTTDTLISILTYIIAICVSIYIFLKRCRADAYKSGASPLLNKKPRQKDIPIFSSSCDAPVPTPVADTPTLSLKHIADID